MTEEELAALEIASTTHAGLPASDVSDLIAEVRRLRALPIIETCDDCASMRIAQGGARAKCNRTKDYLATMRTATGSTPPRGAR